MRAISTIVIFSAILLLNACDGGGGGGGGAAPPLNTQPIANAGPTQNVVAGAHVFLDGISSYDVDGDEISFHWSLTQKPTGSSASLSSISSPAPSFVADVAGTYFLQLVVNDGKESSSPSLVQVTASIVNASPVANSGASQNVVVGDSVSLDGSGSSDANGDALTYRWRITSKPGGSSAVLSNATTVSPSFTADIQGVYFAELVVNDGRVDSAPSTVTITATFLNASPIASAGSNRSVTTGDVVTLNGSGSSDADGDPLSFYWAITTKPIGSSSALVYNTTASPSFMADMAGTYIVSLIVSDGVASSAVSSVMITATSVVAVQAHHLWGRSDFSVYLGCLNCGNFASNSVCNSVGTHGSPFASASIWNEFGSYGSPFSSTSAWNMFASTPPGIFSEDGLTFFGYFTANAFKSSRTIISAYVGVLQFYIDTENLDQTHTYACGS